MYQKAFLFNLGYTWYGDYKSGLVGVNKFDDWKFKVFVDLTTKKNFFVTFGLKFGGDFLAYEEDPLVCHAKYLVKVIESSLTVTDLI